jgi:hypothetical protein
MCSTPAGEPAAASEGRDRLGELGQAIEELADAATLAGPGATEGMATHLAEVWQMVADLDPELARRLAGYET